MPRSPLSISDILQISPVMRNMIEDINRTMTPLGIVLDDKQVVYLGLYSYLLSVDPEFDDDPIDAAIELASYPVDKIERIFMAMEKKHNDTQKNKGGNQE